VRVRYVRRRGKAEHPLSKQNKVLQANPSLACACACTYRPKMESVQLPWAGSSLVSRTVVEL